MSKRSRWRWPTTPLDRCSADDCSTVFREGKGQMEAARQGLHGRGPEGSGRRPRLDAATNFGGPALVNVKIGKGSARERQEFRWHSRSANISRNRAAPPPARLRTTDWPQSRAIGPLGIALTSSICEQKSREMAGLSRSI
jgi:hypothetical protein